MNSGMPDKNANTLKTHDCGACSRKDFLLNVKFFRIKYELNSTKDIYSSSILIFTLVIFNIK